MRIAFKHVPFRLCASLVLSTLLTTPSFSYTTPGTGVVWTGDDLVANSGGVVVFNATANRYESSEAITIAQDDSLFLDHNFYTGASAEQDFLVEGALRIGDPEGSPTDSISLLGESLDTGDGPGGFRVQETGRLYLDRVILTGGGVWGLAHGVWVYGGSAQLTGCRVGDWVGSAAQVTNGGMLDVEDCVIHDAHEFALKFEGSGSVLRTVIHDFNATTTLQDRPAIAILTHAASSVLIDSCRITGTVDNHGGGVLVQNFDEQDQAVSIRHSVIEDCAYGIKALGAYSTADVVACSLRTNNALGDPELGGAGLYVESGPTMRLLGNVITGNAWGIRAVATTSFPIALNLGETGAEDTLLAGYNTISGNEHGGAVWAISNETPYAISAQNNHWGTMDLAGVEDAILHAADNDSLYGLVTYQPLWNGDTSNLAPRLTSYTPDTSTPIIARYSPRTFRVDAIDPDGDDALMTYAWAQNGTPLGSDSAAAELTFTTADESPVEVEATVTDEAGGATSFFWTVTLMNLPPPEIVSYAPEQDEFGIETGELLDFELVGDTQGRYDLFYRFERNGDLVGEESLVTIPFPEAGVDTVTGTTWYEAEAGSASASRTWTVHVIDPVPPTITTSQPDTVHPVVFEGQTIMFRLDAEPPWAWDMHYRYTLDGDSVSGGNSWIYLFVEPGEYQVECSAWYGEGGDQRTVAHTWTITVQPVTFVEEIGLPTSFDVAAWPNPFNAALRLQVALPDNAPLTLEVYDLTGRRVLKRALGERAAGRHVVTWDARREASGVYFVRVQAGEWTALKKAVLIR